MFNTNILIFSVGSFHCNTTRLFVLKIYQKTLQKLLYWNTKNWWGLIACPVPVVASALYCLVYFYNKILGDIFYFIFDTSRLVTLSTLFFILNSVDVNLCLLTSLRPMFPFYIPSGRSHNQGFSDPCRGFTKGKLAWSGLIRNICWYYLLCFCCKMSPDNVYYVFDTRSLGIMAGLLLL